LGIGTKCLATDEPAACLECMKPSKQTLTLLLLGLFGVLLGLGFKLNHLQGAEEVFNAGLVALLVGVALWVRDVWRR